MRCEQASGEEAGDPSSGVLAEIAAVIGREATMKIVAVRAGTRTYIPATMSPDHWLVATIGRELADKLGRHFAVARPDGKRRRGAPIDIPLAGNSRHTEYLAVLGTEIDSLLDQGLSSREIALRLRITVRSVDRHRAQRRGKAS